MGSSPENTEPWAVAAPALRGSTRPRWPGPAPLPTPSPGHLWYRFPVLPPRAQLLWTNVPKCWVILHKAQNGKYASVTVWCFWERCRAPEHTQGHGAGAHERVSAVMIRTGRRRLIPLQGSHCPQKQTEVPGTENTRHLTLNYCSNCTADASQAASAMVPKHWCPPVTPWAVSRDTTGGRIHRHSPSTPGQLDFCSFVCFSMSSEWLTQHSLLAVTLVTGLGSVNCPFRSTIFLHGISR